MARLTLAQYTAISLQSLFFVGAVTALNAIVVAATETKVFILLDHWFCQHHSLVNRTA